MDKGVVVMSDDQRPTQCVDCRDLQESLRAIGRDNQELRRRVQVLGADLVAARRFSRFWSGRCLALAAELEQMARLSDDQPIVAGTWDSGWGAGPLTERRDASDGEAVTMFDEETHQGRGLKAIEESTGAVGMRFLALGPESGGGE